MLFFLISLEIPEPPLKLPDSLIPVIQKENIFLLKPETLAVHGYFMNDIYSFYLRSSNIPLRNISFNIYLFKDAYIKRNFLTFQSGWSLMKKHCIFENIFAYGYSFLDSLSLFSSHITFTHYRTKSLLFSGEFFYGRKFFYLIKLERGIFFKRSKLSTVFEMKGFKDTLLYRLGFEYSFLKPFDIGFYFNIIERMPEFFIALKPFDNFEFSFIFNHQMVLNSDTLSFSGVPYTTTSPYIIYTKKRLNMKFHIKRFYTKIVYENPIVLPDDSLRPAVVYRDNLKIISGDGISWNFIRNSFYAEFSYGDRRRAWFSLSDTLSLNLWVISSGVIFEGMSERYYTPSLPPYFLFSPFFSLNYRGFEIKIVLYNLNDTEFYQYPGIPGRGRTLYIYSGYNYRKPWRLEMKR